MDAASWVEFRIYLVLLLMCAAAYLGGWIVSLWYNNYPHKKEGKHIGRNNRFKRKKG